MRAAIDAVVAKERKVYGGETPVPGVLIGVWDHAGHSYVRGFGAADLATHRKLTRADHFRIGSNTKTFVISVLLQLVDEGKLGLDDPLSKFDLGVTVPNAENITVRELCEMRSGLFESYDTPEFDKLKMTPDMKFDARTLIGWAVAQKPLFPPGTKYNYSNTNYLLLGLIIESVTKDSIGDQIRKRLLAPFHLTQTSYPTTQAMPEPWAHGYAPEQAGRVGGRQQHDPGVADGRGGRDHLRPSRHEALGRPLCHGKDEQAGDAARAAEMHSDRRGQPLLRPRHWLQRGMVRLHGRPARI